MRYLLVCLLLISNIALSGVVLEKSRIIFDGKNTIQSYMLTNTNQYPVIVQLWVDDDRLQSNDPASTSSPFVVTPAISKINPSRLNEIKLIFSGDNFNLPQDQESLYWLNIYEIPPISNNIKDKNKVILSMLTQFKIIYRPEKLKLQPYELAKRLEAITFDFNMKNTRKATLIANNSTPYIANLSNMRLVGKNNKDEIVKISPQSLTSVVLKPKNVELFEIDVSDDIPRIDFVEYSLIDDNGERVFFVKKFIKN